MFRTVRSDYLTYPKLFLHTKDDQFARFNDISRCQCINGNYTTSFTSVCMCKLSFFAYTVVSFVCRMDLKEALLFYGIILALIGPNHAAITKIRICVEYVVENSRSNKTTLATFSNMTAYMCLRRCAYNLQQERGICEILSNIEACGETTEHHVGSKMVHFGSCKSQVPWVSVWSNLTAAAPYQI